jgi:hypothetical protein
MTLKDSPKSIGSPVAGCGPMQLDLLGGAMTGTSGPPPARASRSRSQESDLPPPIQGICGRTYFESSAPRTLPDTDPLSLWENRLVERLAIIGSTEFALIWRKKVSPAGHAIFRLARSTRLSNGTDSGGSLWPAPKAAAAGPDFAKMERSDTGMSLQTVMAGTEYLPDRMMAMWPAPKASSAGETSRSGDRKDEPLIGALMRQAQWSSPRASDGDKGAPKQMFSGGGQPLPAQMYANTERALWVAPSARDWKDSAGMSTEGEQTDGDQIAIPGLEKHRQRFDQLPRQMVAQAHTWSAPTAANNGKMPPRAHDTGTPLAQQMAAIPDATEAGTPTPLGSSATTKKRGAPNPAFPCWLMGWSDVLTSGALQAIQSTRSSRRKLSARSKT